MYDKTHYNKKKKLKKKNIKGENDLPYVSVL